MDDDRRTWTDAEKKLLKDSLVQFREWKKFIGSIPDQTPVLKTSIRPDGVSGLFFYRLSGLNYEQLAERWFKDRKTDFKRGFVEYLSQLYSILITAELDENEDDDGTRVYSLDLKKINRNYSEFNDVLFQHGLLDLLDTHEGRKKRKKKCRKYAVPKELLNKGVERVFLSEAEKLAVMKSIRVSTKRDQTSRKLTTVLRYYADQLKRTTIARKDFDDLEIEVGQFRELYPRVVRHQQGKLDLKIGPKEGRLYSTYLYAPKIFRRLLRWNKKHPMVEGDVAASHFHLLLGEMTDANERQEMMKDLVSSDPYLAMCGDPKGVLRADLKGSSHQFKYGSRATKYPRMTDAEWWEMRRRKRTILYRDGLFFRHLSMKYPRFADTMAKKRIFGPNQKSLFACEIMRRESEVMVQKVGRRCMKEKLVYLPIHDGFLTLPGQYDRVCQIITETFLLAVGSVPKIKPK